MSVAVALFVLVAARSAGPTGGVFPQTKHGNATTGVNRTPDWPIGSCEQCHVQHDGTSPNAFALFAPNTNSLCYTAGCHANPGANGIYQGPNTYNASSHATSTSMVWPGPDPTLDPSARPARPSGDWGKCVNCHDPHGYNRDGTGLIPSLAFSREEKLCLVCHDGSPASKNVKAQFTKAYKHPTLTVSGRHSVSEDGTPSAYAASPTNNRHAECEDCHNPHAVKGGYLVPATSSYLIMGVGRIQVTNGGAGATPTYAYLAGSDTTAPIAEYQLCFKCHSSWVGVNGLPTGAKDKAVEFNPNNESFHPVEAPGKNTTTAMTNNLNGGTGLPHLTTSSAIWCSDCHNTDDLPTNVSTLSNYTGSVPKGPHGSNVGSIDTTMSPKILRANYRVKLMPINTAYSASNF